MNAETDKKPRPRSPEFPFIPLNEAIPKVRQLLDANQRHPARIKTLATLWDYSAASSSFLRIVAALRVFGLVEETGSGDDRKISVSDLGTRIVSDTRPGAREACIQKAFESCAILNDYHQRWGKRRPSDTACISELTLDNGFTPTAARKFISVYDDSVAFLEAHGGDGENLDEETPPSDSAPGQSTFAQTPASATTHQTQTPPIKTRAGVEMTEATYPIAEGKCTLVYPKGISPKSAQRLKKWLDLMLEDVNDIATTQPNHDDSEKVEEQRA